MKLKFIKPDKKKVNRVTQKEMLKEAVSLLILWSDYDTEKQVRALLRGNVLKNRG